MRGREREEAGRWRGGRSFSFVDHRYDGDMGDSRHRESPQVLSL